mgnify:CR=1 FL=1
MKYFLLCAVFITALFLQIASAAAFGGKKGEGALEQAVIEHGGYQRIYWIYDPRSGKEGAAAGKRPLILALHGGGGKAEKFHTSFGDATSMRALADREDILIVYPQGYKRQWNDGRGVDQIPAQNLQIDDIGFLSALIDLMIAKRDADPLRVYATGISNGGFMSNRAACELSKKIAAVGIVTAGMPIRLAPLCKPEAPVAVLIMNGTQDPFCPFNGGMVGRKKKPRGEMMSTLDSFYFWLKQAGYKEAAPLIRPKVLPDKDKTDDTRVFKQSFRGDAGQEVMLYTVEGGGHTWPGGWQYLPEFVIGKVSRDIDGTNEIWDFFVRNPKKAIKKKD